VNFIQRTKDALATPLMRKLLRRPGIFPVRAQLARAYVNGSGIEVGAMNAPLVVADGVVVRYADIAGVPALQTSYNRVHSIQEPDIISDLESMTGIADASQDFVIANHVLEHVESPILAMHSVARVLKLGGIAFITLPDKNFTFDKGREVTPLKHMIRDFEEGPDWSRKGHYIDWVENVDRIKGAEARARIEKMTASRENIHFHVWDFDAMRKFFSYLSEFTIEHSQFNRSEGIWILRKL
jgi:SAM-dependent methyltransferase